MTIWKKVTALLLSAAMLIPTYGCVRGSSLSQKKDPVEFQARYEPVKTSEVAEEDGVYYVSGQILLTAAEGASYKKIETLAKENGGEIIGYISTTGDYQIRFPQIPTLDALDTLSAKLLESALVDEAMPAYAAQFSCDSVNYSGDPWINTDKPKDTSGSVWDEEKPDGNNWWAEAIGMPTVWGMDLQTQTVKVGIIDSMFDTSNPDLDEGLFVKTWFNPENEDGSCRVPQEYQAAAKAYEEVKKSKDKKVLEAAKTRFNNSYHGTHVAGIIAAQANNGFGITGINQNVQLYGYALQSKEAAASADAQWGTIFIYKCAISHLLNEGVKVINFSQGINAALVGARDGDAVWSKFISVNSAALESFLLKYIEAGQEFLIVKSAGNDSSKNTKYDPKYDVFGAIQNERVADRILIVGAAKYNRDHNYYSITSFSNAGSRVDVYAPGQSVLSDLPDCSTGLLDGTSMAAPIVTGLVSLIWGVNPDLSAEQVREIIQVSTSATIFNLDHKWAWVRALINWVADPTAIVNAPICVSLAQTTVGSGYSSSHEFGTVTGMVFAVNAEQSDFVDMELQSLTLFNESGEATAVQMENMAFKVPDSQTGDYHILNLKSYSLLLAPGTYTLRAEAAGYDPQEQTITVKPGEAVTADCKFVKAAEKRLSQVNEYYTSGGCAQYNFNYNTDGQLTSVMYNEYYNTAHADHSGYFFTYDSNGQLVQIRYDRELNPSYEYFYNEEGQLIQYNLWEHNFPNEYHLTYNEKGQLIKSTGDLEVVYTYDDSGKLIRSIGHGYRSDMSCTEECTYSYDAYGRLAEEVVTTTYSNETYGGTEITKYNYDFYPFVLTESYWPNLDELSSRYILSLNTFPGDAIIKPQIDVPQNAEFKMEDGYLVSISTERSTIYFLYDDEVDKSFASRLPPLYNENELTGAYATEDNKIQLGISWSDNYNDYCLTYVASGIYLEEISLSEILIDTPTEKRYVFDLGYRYYPDLSGYIEVRWRDDGSALGKYTFFASIDGLEDSGGEYLDLTRTGDHLLIN